MLPHGDEEISLAGRHPEEEKGLNVIICVVVMPMQPIKVSAEGSCWLFSTFSHVLFLLAGFGGWAGVLEKDAEESVLSSLQCHLRQGLKLVHF